MGIVSLLVDALLVLYFAVLAVAIPAVDAQLVAPPHLHPPALVELTRRYAAHLGHYLIQEKPHFYVGLAWIQLSFVWPLSLLNLYSLLARRSWARTTLLMAGVSGATMLATIMAEFLGSGRASEKLLQMYVPFMALPILATLRGLFPPRRHSLSASTASHASSRKKRAGQ